MLGVCGGGICPNSGNSGRGRTMLENKDLLGSHRASVDQQRKKFKNPGLGQTWRLGMPKEIRHLPLGN